MSTVLITYDIEKTTNTIHTEVKKAMIAIGYSEFVPKKSGGGVQLPNTTLVRDKITPSQATADLKTVCKSKNAVLEKYISLTITYEGGEAEAFK